MSTAKYERLSKVATEVYNEKMYCSVLALAVVADVSFGKAHAALKRAGRKDRRRTPMPILFTACKELGVDVGVEEATTGVTVSKICKRLDKGTYLIMTRGHIAAMVDGVVHDWTQGRRHRVVATLAIGEAA